MSNCKHFAICGLTDEADPEAGLCILHSQKPDKAQEAFRKALDSHRAKSVDYRLVLFPTTIFFGNTVFEKRCNFSGAVFSEIADFASATFSGGADFNGTSFKEGAVFHNAVFDGDVHFTMSMFTERASFFDVSFHGEAQFYSVTFTKEVSFAGASFKKSGSFAGSTFHMGGDFTGARFEQGDATFTGSSFLGRTRFSSPPDESVGLLFAKDVEVAFRRVRVDPPDALEFIGVDLSKCSFWETDLRGMRFLGVQWVRMPWTRLSKGWRNGIYDEVLLRAQEIKPYAKVETLYRQLKKNYEEQRDYERAGDFHYGEKEMRLRNPKTSPGLRLFLWLYKCASGYGERWLPPIVWSLCLLLLGSAGYLYCGLRVAGRLLPFEWDMWNAVVDGVPMWVRSLLFSLRTMTLLKPDDMVPLGWGSVVQTVQNLLGPILLGLAALAIRQRLRR
ncbi:MAG: pentapeptide repeat-containing protein [candidate division NC10 bacterium]|nr:pentapeptide repeat-containing protein [candidate division NC10 bacterium]